MAEIHKEKWEEICFILAESVNSNIYEDIYEQRILMILEKLGWSQYRKEIVIRPSVQVGRQGYIQPDIVICGPESKAVIVVEVKRPTEDIAKDTNIDQLKSYMRQMKSSFGFLVGRELHIYYDGSLNLHKDPLLIDKIQFDRNSDAGKQFVELFNKDDFLEKKYESHVKESISRHEKHQKLQTLKNRLLSETTKQGIKEFIKTKFADFEPDILEEAMNSLIINFYYEDPSHTPKTKIIPGKVLEKTSKKAQHSNTEEESSEHGETQWSSRSKKQWTFIQNNVKKEWDNTKIHSNGIEIPTNKGTLLVKKPRTIVQVGDQTFLQAALLLDGNPLSFSNTLNLGKYEGRPAIERLRKIVERVNNS